ncbi:MAG: MBOAT family O-acyltransferase [Planctomycetota bacterium]
MLFNSVQYMLFLPMVVALYYALPPARRWPLLLGASYYFYMCWRPEYALLLLLSTAVDYWSAIQMAARTTRRARRPFLYLSLAGNLGLLFAFKYFNFFTSSIERAGRELGILIDLPHLNILLPVGISFYTFQTLSYAIDVYRGETRPERHFGYFALFVSYFPQLVAGPIERFDHLNPQLRQPVRFDSANVRAGLQIMLWGFFKKIVIADRLAIYVNQVYGAPGDYAGLPLWLATYAFAVQIYCDFSGYSDIAVGTARILGHKLMVNFRTPYFARSIQEFWQRWHVSLSQWFRDYVYIPLGGNRGGPARWYANLCIVFLLSGLWHGANWTFAIWGALHGSYLVLSLATRKWRSAAAARMQFDRCPRLTAFGSWFVTLQLVIFAWIFFRAQSTADAWHIITHLLAPAQSPSWPPGFFTSADAALAITSLALLFGAEAAAGDAPLAKLGATRWRVVAAPAYGLLMVFVLLAGTFGSQDFLYFQF